MNQLCDIKNPLMRWGTILYFFLKGQWYRLRYPQLTLASGVLIRGHLTIQGPVKVEIGPHSRLGKSVKISGSGQLRIGQNVSLNGCWIGCDKEITIGDDCLISDCNIQDTDYHNLEPRLRQAPPGSKVSAPIVIERNVWVGARSAIMKGVCIGQDSVIGLGSVIRKSVPAGVVAIGNPQQIVKRFTPEQLTAPIPPTSIEATQTFA